MTVEIGSKLKENLESLCDIHIIQQLIDSIGKGICLCDKSGNIIFNNSHLLKMFGFSKQEMEMKIIEDLFVDYSNIKKVYIGGNELFEEEVIVNTKTNKLRFTLSIYGITNKIINKLYIFEDIKKERKNADVISHNQAIYTFEKIIGKSMKLRNLIEFAKKISDSKSTVLITGKTGTGKELFAQSIHNHSNRRKKPFVAINSAAIPKNLIESELFGYVEGAFTGAKKSGQPGKFEIADKGTIFLDEIGEMPLDMQTRLLRVIEEGVVSRVGDISQKSVDVRIIAASNKDLKLEVEKGNFREDLYYRLFVLPLELPTLEDRKEDIPVLMDYFGKKISKRLNKKEVKVSKSELDELMEHSWPGNIRELENFVELMINLEYVPLKINRKGTETSDDFISKLEDLSLETLEKFHILEVLQSFGGNISHAAKALEIGRNTLYRKIENYGIDCSSPNGCVIKAQ